MAKTLRSLLAVACSILASTQLLAADKATDPYSLTQDQGATASETLKSAASDSLASITTAAGDDPKNADIVSDAKSKIAAKEKDGLDAVDSAVATAKSAYDAAGDDQNAIDAASSDATTHIETAVSTAMSLIGEITKTAMSAMQ